MNARPEGLEIELVRLYNAVLHLENTNALLEEEIKENGHDPILREAIGENIVVIAKYKGQIERLEQEIKRSLGQVTDITLTQESSVAVAVAFDVTADPINMNESLDSNSDDKKDNGFWL